MSGSSLLTAFLLSLVICALYASVDFNRPSWASSYTSAPRYRCALGAYIVLYWLVFLIALSLLMVWLTVSSDHDSASGTEFSLAEIVWTASAITLCGHWVLS